MPTGYQIPDPLPWATIAGPLAAAEDRLARLDERLATSPIRARLCRPDPLHRRPRQFVAEGALVHLDDLVLHDDGMDIRAPTHELTRAHAVLRTRRRIADGKPDWALSAAGLAGLRGRGGRGESDENTGYRNEEGDEALSIDDDDADAAEPCEVPPTDDRLADVFAAVDAAIAQTNRTLVANSTSQERRPSERGPLIYDPDWHEDARVGSSGNLPARKSAYQFAGRLRSFGKNFNASNTCAAVALRSISRSSRTVGAVISHQVAACAPTRTEARPRRKGIRGKRD